jgi:hypothetical protein
MQMQVSAVEKRAASDLLTQDSKRLQPRHGLQGGRCGTINTIEDAIDESRRGYPAKAPGQLDPFIEDNFSRLWAVQQLECAQAKHIAIDSGHARQLPVVGRLTQPAINVALMDDRAIVKGQAVAAQRIAGETIGDEHLDVLARHMGIEVALIQELKSHFTGLGASDHPVMVGQAEFGG